MPIIKSAKKRVRTAKKATLRNAKTKRTLKAALKTFQVDLAGKKSAGDSHAKAQSALDTAVKKGIIHANKAARIKKQLAAKAKTAGVKTVGSAKKVVAKPAAKKTVAKKPATKKSPAKKPTAKKK